MSRKLFLSNPVRLTQQNGYVEFNSGRSPDDILNDNELSNVRHAKKTLANGVKIIIGPPGLHVDMPAPWLCGTLEKVIQSIKEPTSLSDSRNPSLASRTQVETDLNKYFISVIFVSRLELQREGSPSSGSHLINWKSLIHHPVIPFISKLFTPSSL